MAGQFSHGRGGAGNIAPRSPALTPVDLETPTIKSSTYTTGRGGNGNMQPNVHPDITRQTQDVEAPSRVTGRNPEAGIQYGRGGAGNTIMPSKEEIVNLRGLSQQRVPTLGSYDGNGNGKGKGREDMDEKPKKEVKEEKPKKEQKNVVEKGVDMISRVMSKGQ